MVASIINNKVNFTEKPDIEDEDIGFLSDVFELDLFDASKTIAVVLGKPKYKYATQNVIYFPIYAISKDSLVGKIGVFEIKSHQIQYIYKKDNTTIDLAKLSPPLLFSAYGEADDLDALSADPEYYHKKEKLKEHTTNAVTKEQQAYSEKIINAEEQEQQINTEEQEQEQEQQINDEEKKANSEVFELNVDQMLISPEKQKSISKLKNGIFTMKSGFILPAMLDQETEKQANELRANFTSKNTNDWVKERMQNNNYSIVENEAGGDCFFATIRDAYAQIGRITTVEKLREIIANELTTEEFENKKSISRGFEMQKKEKEFIMKDLYKKYKDAQQLVKYKDAQQLVIADKEYTMEERSRLINEANQFAIQHKIVKAEYKEIEKMEIDYVGVVKDIKTIDEMRDHIKTRDFWADAWAIVALEHALNMKIIIMSEQDPAGLLQCGESQNSNNATIDPEFYIITSFGNSHYRLVNYKNKGILKFSELPYDLKIVIVNKCLERNSGAFYLIKDFRTFKEKFGLPPDLGEPLSYVEDANMIGLFDESVVFMFNSRAAKAPKPGMADGERIPPEMKAKFIGLAKIDEWRKKLDDMWDKAYITVDNHKWASVEHYVQGAKYKKGFHDVYLMFSLDSESEISKDVKKAKTSHTHKGLKEGLRIDADYGGRREEEERELALWAKFSDNLDMKTLLINTGSALLMHKEGTGKEPIPDTALMKLRAKLLL